MSIGRTVIRYSSVIYPDGFETFFQGNWDGHFLKKPGIMRQKIFISPTFASIDHL
jgi:hypothetical protein